MAFILSSPAIHEHAAIPVRHTCDGANVPPPLAWTEPPPGTRSFALVLDDPDAPSGTFTHWLLWNLPASMRALPESLKGTPAVSGTNDFGRTGYGGPCPPKGHGPHRYRFRLYALSEDLPAAPGAGRTEIDEALSGRVLGSTLLTGRYERRR